MRIKAIFEEESFGDETIFVSLDNSILNGIMRANESAGFILSCFKENTTRLCVISKVIERYRIDKATASNAVDHVIKQLEDLNLLEE